jgi:hypothetical protein
LQSPTFASVTIIDGQAEPFLQFTTTTVVTEPVSGSLTINLNLRLSNPSTFPASVRFSTINVSAEAGSDYLPVNGALTFAPFETQKTVSIQVLADEDYFEADEILRLAFSQPSNLSFGSPATIRILNYRPTVGTGVTLVGRVASPQGINLRNAVVILTDELGVRTTSTTSSFGLYSFGNVITGRNYTLSVSSKRYRFAPKQISVGGQLSNVDFVGLE